jgi:hypothetical protein
VSHEHWSHCLRALFCQCTFCPNFLQVEEDDYIRLGKMIQRYFMDVRGVVVSDILAGLGLLRAFRIANPGFVRELLLKKLKEEFPEEKMFEEKEDVENQTRAEDISTLVQEAAYYSGHFTGAYGAGLYSMMRPWECCFLCCTWPYEHCVTCSHPHIQGGDCLNRSRNAFLRRAKIEHEDLICASLEEGFL